MKLWVTVRNLRTRALPTLLTVLAVALASTLALVVPMVTRSVERGAANAAQVFDLLVTPKGSPTRAVMSSLFYLQAPIGNLPYRTYEELARDPHTRRAVPVGLGDNYVGFPIVGTSVAFFEQRVKPRDPPYFRVAQGRMFGRPFEAVLGSQVAAQTGLAPGGHLPQRARHVRDAPRGGGGARGTRVGVHGGGPPRAERSWSRLSRSGRCTGSSHPRGGG